MTEKGAEMKRWEYQLLELSNEFLIYDRIMVNQRRLDIQGDNGWELVAVIGSVAYLKRELITEND